MGKSKHKAKLSSAIQVLIALQILCVAVFFVNQNRIKAQQAKLSTYKELYSLLNKYQTATLLAISALATEDWSAVVDHRLTTQDLQRQVQKNLEVVSRDPSERISTEVIEKDWKETLRLSLVLLRLKNKDIKSNPELSEFTRVCETLLTRFRVQLDLADNKLAQKEKLFVFLAIGVMLLTGLGTTLLFWTLKRLQRREQDLMSAQKLALVGQNTAEIVHNLNNPLAIILTSAEILAIENPDEAAPILSAGHRLARMIKDTMVAVRSNDSFDREEVNLKRCVEQELLGLSKGGILDRDLKVRTDLEEVPVFWGQPVHWKQVISNLVRNSVEAMMNREGKKLLISLKSQGEEIVLTIADSGGGIPTKKLGSVFEPLYTTKSSIQDGVEGTGLGLSYCQNMVKSYGGEISVESVVDQGTSFTITLPISHNSKAEVA